MFQPRLQPLSQFRLGPNAAESAEKVHGKNEFLIFVLSAASLRFKNRHLA